MTRCCFSITEQKLVTFHEQKVNNSSSNHLGVTDNDFTSGCFTSYKKESQMAALSALVVSVNELGSRKHPTIMDKKF